MTGRPTKLEAEIRQKYADLMAAQIAENDAAWKAKIETLEEKCDEEMGEWACVQYPYIPLALEELYNVREAIRELLK